MRRDRALHWSPSHPWTIPRDLKCTPPAGMTWAAPGRLLLIGPQRAREVIRPDDWGPEVAPQVSAVMLVSAVQAWVICLGCIPLDGRVFTRRPRVFHLRPGEGLSVSAAESRTGELWAFPLTHLIGPPRPAIN